MGAGEWAATVGTGRRSMLGAAVDSDWGRTVATAVAEAGWPGRSPGRRVAATAAALGRRVAGRMVAVAEEAVRTRPAAAAASAGRRARPLGRPVGPGKPVTAGSAGAAVVVEEITPKSAEPADMEVVAEGPGLGMVGPVDLAVVAAVEPALSSEQPGSAVEPVAAVMVAAVAGRAWERRYSFARGQL